MLGQDIFRLEAMGRSIRLYEWIALSHSLPEGERHKAELALRRTTGERERLIADSVRRLRQSAESCSSLQQ